MEWEYLLADAMSLGSVDLDEPLRAKRYLDEFGADGWELITITPSYLFFKRQKPITVSLGADICGVPLDFHPAARRT